MFLMVLEDKHFEKEMSHELHKILRDIFWVYLFVESLIIFIGHFLKNKNRYLHYMKKIYAKNFEVYMYWFWSSSEKSSFSKSIASVFSPLPTINFS